MNRTIMTGIAGAAVLLSAMAGYKIGAGQGVPASTPAKPAVAAKATEPAARAILYWKDPDGHNDVSSVPKKTADGRDYLPVHEEQEIGFADAKPAQPRGSAKILYYRNPMGLADISKVPKKDGMGMDYIPVYEGEEDASSVKVSLDRVQRSGVRSEAARMQNLARPVRAAGIAKPDERTLRSVTLRADGFIEKLYVNETGRHVKAGEPLFSVYSPSLLRALIDLRTSAPPGQISAEERLQLLQVPPAVIAEARRGNTLPRSFDFPSPASGVVMEKMIVEGMMIKMGEPLYRLADLGSIWVIASVSEQDIGMVTVGAPAKMTFRAYPGESFEGRVTFILHELDMATRTAKVRIEVKNPEHRIKHEMFADVEIDAGSGDADRLVVPVSAVIDSGNRQVVIIDKGAGRFEPRAVRLGRRGDGFIEILEGLEAGEQVVTAANFLIDSESNLKAALRAFMAEPKIEVKPVPEGKQ